MNILKKIILSTTSSAILLAPFATVISCGHKSGKAGPVGTKAELFLVTDGGSITDHSFNQQASEALDKILGSIKNDKKLTPSGHDAAAIVAKYSAAKQAGAKTILTPGFYHEKAVKSWNDSNGVGQLNFIIADSSKKYKNVAAIHYQTSSAGFLAGYMASEYLKIIGDDTPTLATFGGGDFPGVTDYMVGFVKGAKYWNTNRKNGEHAVKFFAYVTDKAWTNTGFKIGDGTSNSQAAFDGGADILFPVAGPQTADALAVIHGSQKVIGVDTNMKLSYSKDSAKILTSALKDVKNSLIAVYNEISKKAGFTVPSGIKGLNEISEGTLGNGFTGIEETGTGNIIGASPTATWKSLYDKVNTSDIKTAAKNILGTTWADALKIAKSMNNNAEK